MQHRDKRVADAIRDAVAEIILNKLSDPGIGFVTVTRCHVTRDLRNATVYLSVMGQPGQQQASLEHIRHATSYIRRLVGHEIKLRYLPEIRFELDDVLAHEQRVGEILDDIKAEEQAGCDTDQTGS